MTNGKSDLEATCWDLFHDVVMQDPGNSGTARAMRFMLTTDEDADLPDGDDVPDSFKKGGERLVVIPEGEGTIDMTPCDCGAPDCNQNQGEAGLIIVARGDTAYLMLDAYNRAVATQVVGPLAMMLPPEALQAISNQLSDQAEAKMAQREMEEADPEQAVTDMLSGLGIEVLPIDPVEEHVEDPSEEA